MDRLKPSDIYFTHSVISDKFTGCGKMINQTLNEIVDGITSIDEIPTIKVFYTQENGVIKYFSENNRRLWLFKTLESLGKVDTIPVRLEKTNNKKYIKNTYSLKARIKKYKTE